MMHVLYKNLHKIGASTIVLALFFLPGCKPPKKAAALPSQKAELQTQSDLDGSRQLSIACSFMIPGASEPQYYANEQQQMIMYNLVGISLSGVCEILKSIITSDGWFLEELRSSPFCSFIEASRPHRNLHIFCSTAAASEDRVQVCVTIGENIEPS